ncbi:protoporphyrinogen oxidase [Galendromus occidentalis]|uniref:Protoporphyrinogen oxidase n=1 Tax=Galendromus occidentalis TaxID=34638 RepID=A0AAJ6QQP7_9ACAR|nr:protoporphyrinogen oxidase [Galendromus occidentalis]
MPRSMVVLGGGISGLATVFYLTRIPAIRRITLVDKKARLGGWIQSTRYPCGTVDEHGPHSIRSVGPAAKNTFTLIEQLGLEKELIPVAPNTLRGRLIYYDNGLHWLPSTFGDLVKIRKPFTVPLIFPVAREILRKPEASEDESLHSFVRRRFNAQLADYVIDPMCRGICAGDSKEISVRSLLPQAFHAEKIYGSVVRGLQKMSENPNPTGLAKRARDEKWGAFSFQQGLQTLIDKLVEHIGNDPRVTIYENEDKVQLSEDNGTFTVRYAGGETVADHLFACVPAKALSRMMSRVEPSMSTVLLEIPIAHVVSCTLEFPGHLLKHRAFGYLVPSSQKSRVLGMIFDSCCFPQHDGQFIKKTRVTCLMGGRWFSEYFGDIKQTNEALFAETALEACRDHLGITAKPIRDLTNILPNCIPQYQVGHYKTVEKLKSIIAERKLQMSLLGSSYEGLSVNDCILNAKIAVDRLVEEQKIN